MDCAGATTPGSSLSNLTDVDGKLFFTASDARGSALWRSTGTAGGTVLLKRIGSDGYDYDYGNTNMVGVDGTLFFTVDGEDDNAELWRSDGTRAGTVLVKRFPSDDGEYGGNGPDNLTAVGDTLFFTASDGVHGEELWRSNGTRTGTVMVKDIRPGGDSGGGYDDYAYGPSNLTAVEDTLFFTADDGVRGHEVWRSDGTKAGTVLVKNIRAGSYGSYAGQLTAVGDDLFFRARDGVHGSELWRSDGTSAGTALVEDIRPGGVSASPEGLVASGDTLFFSADDGASGRDLWVSDGTAAGTVHLEDFLITDDDYSYGLGEIVAVGDGVLFAADDGTHGLELWGSDGTEAGTVLVKDIRAGDYPSDPGSLTAVGESLFFTARDGRHGQELWRSDGTEAGTSLVEDIFPDSRSSRPRELTASDGELFFRAEDGRHGDELWRSDGTEAGTSMVVDINKGGAFFVSSRARYNPQTGRLRISTAFEGSGTVEVAPVREGGIRRLERDVSGSDFVRLTLTPALTRAAKRTLRRTGQVSVGARFTFESCGGAVRSITRHYTVKMR